jgi:hypothetical protein
MITLMLARDFLCALSYEQHRGCASDLTRHVISMLTARIYCCTAHTYYDTLLQVRRGRSVKRELMTVAFGKSTLPGRGTTAASASTTTMSRSPRPIPGGLSYNGLHKTAPISSSSNSEHQRRSSSGNAVVSAQELLAVRNGRVNGQSNGFDNSFDADGSIVNGLDSSEQELLREEALFVATQRLADWLNDAAQEAATAGTALQVLLRLHAESAAACVSGDTTGSSSADGSGGSGDVVQRLAEFRGTMASMGLFGEACGPAPGVWQEGSAEAVQV